VTVTIDGKLVAVDTQMSVAAAIAVAGVLRTHVSVSGETRFALCGMGMCQECRVSIDGVAHRLACQVRCLDGMEIVTA
jgi:aerobic-type carbon monoxide dehydrogenase small subunit (CoxS/CutS family)